MEDQKNQSNENELKPGEILTNAMEDLTDIEHDIIEITQQLILKSESENSLTKVEKKRLKYNINRLISATSFIEFCIYNIKSVKI